MTLSGYHFGLALMVSPPLLVLVTPGAGGMSFRDRPVYFTRDKVIIHLPLVDCNLF